MANIPHLLTENPASSHPRLNVEQIISNVQISPHLQRLFELQQAATGIVNNIPDSQIEHLREYYKFVLNHRRQVVANVLDPVWKFDLASSLAAIFFARERVELVQHSTEETKQAMEDLIALLCSDMNEDWFDFAVKNGRTPTMIAMPPFPAINLGIDEERYYVLGVSDTWPTKIVSSIENDVLVVSADASRNFKNNEAGSDLGGLRIQLSQQELSYISNHAVGWVSRYETPSQKVMIIEVDPIVDGELSVDKDSRKRSYVAVRTPEQRLDMYTLTSSLMHEDDAFRDNFLLSRLLVLDHVRSPIQVTEERIDVGTYIHVNGSDNHGLGPVDENVLMKSLGSITAKNKVRSAMSLGAKMRLTALERRGEGLRDIQWTTRVAGDVHTSRMMRCGTDGVVIQTRAPADTLAIMCVLCAVSIQFIRSTSDTFGKRMAVQMGPWAIVGIVGIAWAYHNLRYMGWSLEETVRLRRTCCTDEQLRLHMTEQESLSTIASAGAAGMPMDGLMSCPFSNSNTGTFSVGEPVSLEAASRAGLAMRITTSLKPVWVDGRGVRNVEICNGNWQCVGPYLDVSYLNLTMHGPDCIGGTR